MKSKIIIALGSCVMVTVLCGCPGNKVDPGNAHDSALGKISYFWGVPLVRTITAGFNGFPSEPNNAGPANTTTPKKVSP